ncbi:prostaglandin F synthase 1-like [Diabrotica virgifera virgifera]|uniref:Prostaglandin F synthase 1-like n=1 Tax=Diabrotica virgifera virgifera TaxID=50390 RepID=A0A6P7GN59_DIAVI|nr:prostaglandin F synthase 1-like [Diabrotica virgifera virgifera]
MPSIGYGTYTVQNEVEAFKALDKALEVGYRHIDTATVYANEHIIGKVLQKWFSEKKLKREDIFVTTKLNLFNSFPDSVESSIKESLMKLQLDYVDMFLIHAPVALKVFENNTILAVPNDHLALWKKMEEQVDAGRTRSIGLSNFNVSQIEKIMKSSRIKPANLQIEMHVYDQEKATRQFCKKTDIVIVAYAPLGAVKADVYLADLGFKTKAPLNMLEDEQLIKIAAAHNKTTAQVALRFLHQLGVVVIPKSINPKRIEENYDIFNFILSPNEMKTLKQLDKGIKYKVYDFKYLGNNIADNPEYPWSDLRE